MSHDSYYNLFDNGTLIRINVNGRALQNLSDFRITVVALKYSYMHYQRCEIKKKKIDGHEVEMFEWNNSKGKVLRE